LGRLLANRLALSLEIISTKSKLGLPTYDPRRESEILARLTASFKDTGEREFLNSVYKEVLRRSVSLARKTLKT